MSGEKKSYSEVFNSHLIKTYLNDLCLVESTFINTFQKIDNELKFFESEYWRTTATLVLIKDYKIFCANVGDSKEYIIYDKNYKQISFEHKCNVDDERTRIIEAGGKIIKNRVMGQLTLTRTIWDLYVKQFGVCNIPYISCNDIGKNMSEAGKVGQFCGDIVKLSINKGNKDNVSCIMISFKDWYILIEGNIFSNNFFLFLTYFFVYTLNI